LFGFWTFTSLILSLEIKKLKKRPNNETKKMSLFRAIRVIKPFRTLNNTLKVPVKPLSTFKPMLKRAEVSVTFITADGEKHLAKAKEGDNLLDIVIDQEIDIDGFGACEGTLACSTCHLIFKQEDFDKLPDEATDEELDMLDLAYELTDTSRLGCQVCMTKELDGIVVSVPEGINDQR